jgi:hypothetical protein
LHQSQRQQLNYSQQQRERAAAMLDILEEAKEYRSQHKREFVEEAWWYPWQRESFDTFARQWMTMAANQIGKTISEAFHFALDATGHYPDWWTGYKFTHAPNMLAMGIDAEQLRVVIQPELFGEILEPPGGGRKFFSGGWIHRNEIGRISWSQVSNVAKQVEVIGRYGRAQITLRTASQTKTGTGSLTIAGTRICRIWVDECPPDEIIGQLNARVINGNLNKGGHIGYTMTPELGATNLVTSFMENRSKTRILIGPVGWDKAPHITKEKQEAVLVGIPDHEKDMRTKGIPFFGEGMVYSCPDNRIKTEAFRLDSIPWLKYIRAMDIGINHPTAIVWLAYDSEIDRIYVLRTYSEADSAAAVHAAAANSYLDFAPCVFPHDIGNREKGSGKTVRQYYADAGLTNTLDFKNHDGTIHVEPGILEIDDRMRTDRFMVVESCEQFFREKGTYHREKGMIVKKNDDIMDATRYGAMMIQRYGVPMGGQRLQGRRPRVIKSI